MFWRSEAFLTVRERSWPFAGEFSVVGDFKEPGKKHRVKPGQPGLTSCEGFLRAGTFVPYTDHLYSKCQMVARKILCESGVEERI
jgi:hypothetical protein